jgi:hypothetical protein
MRKLMTLAIVGLVAGALLIPSAALAKDGDVLKAGACTGASTWELKVGPEDPALLDIEFEVDQNVVGAKWKVKLRHNGELAVKVTRKTKAPSGSFTFDYQLPDTAGNDNFRAVATNLATGEKCVGVLTFKG